MSPTALQIPKGAIIKEGKADSESDSGDDGDLDDFPADFFRRFLEKGASFGGSAAEEPSALDGDLQRQKSVDVEADDGVQLEAEKPLRGDGALIQKMG